MASNLSYYPPYDTYDNFLGRAFGYQKAISALKNHPRRVESREEAAAIPNVGSKMADKIMEIIEEGSLRKVLSKATFLKS